MAKQQREAGVKSRIDINNPDMYDVVLLNDDFTTMEFVVKLLREVFFHNESEAQAIMLSVHHSGAGIAGTYTLDIACSKARKSVSMARNQGFPLNVQVIQHIT